LQQYKKISLFVSFVGLTALKHFNEMQSHCYKNGSDCFLMLFKAISDAMLSMISLYLIPA